MSNISIDEFNDTRWFNDDGELHRLDGPAFVGSDGSKSWWLHGKCHRLNNPALIFTSGSKSYYQNGVLHRLDGPAMELSNGDAEWYSGGICITYEVTEWMEEQNIIYPFDEPTQMLFMMKFG